jgi:hypothetical protein
MSQSHRWTAADVERYQRRLVGQTFPQVRRKAPEPMAYRIVPPVQKTETGWILTYTGWLPKISGHQVNRFARSRLTNLGRRTFGVLPPVLYPTGRAQVQIIRVLGPRQKPMDRDSISQLTAGLTDSLKPSYVRDDSEKYADLTYRNDDTRRQDGPAIRIVITYIGKR